MMKHIFKTLISLKTAVVIITLLSILAIIGTLLPQNLESTAYIAKYPKFGGLFLALGFDDIYRSPSFIGLLALLSLSTVLCIWVRFKAANKHLINRIQKATIIEITHLPARKHLTEPLRANWEEAFDKVIKKGSSTVALKSTGFFSIGGGLLLHIGLLLILIGGLVGLLFGVETVIHGREGSKVPIPSLGVLKAAKKADELSKKARYIRNANPDNPILNEYRSRVDTLHKIYSEGVANPEFYISFNRLWVDYYHNKNNEVEGVKSWNSQVSFTVNEKTAKDAIIQVNEPTTFNEYTFYQASWQKYYPKIKLQVELFNPDDHKNLADDFPKEIELSLNKPVKFPWYEYDLVLIDFKPDFRIINGNFVSVTNELNNPAARIMAIDTNNNNEEKSRAWGFAASQSMLAAHVSNMPFVFTIASVDTNYESILTVSHDPGKALVWLGCLLFGVGMLFCFGYGYTERWLIIDENGEKTLAITGNRAKTFFTAELEKLEQELFCKTVEDANE
jgi:cytochrome c biogenesis protein ResB